MQSICSQLNHALNCRVARRQDFQRRRNRGISLLETALVLAVFAVVIASFMRFTSESSELIRARAGAQKISEVVAASELFIQSNLQDLFATAPLPPDALVVAAGRPDANSPVPAGSLQAQGFLAESFIDVNSYGQRHFLLVQQNPAGRIDALVATAGGREAPDAMLGRMVGFLGAAGGFVPNNPANGDEGQIIGAFGGWRSLIANWGPAETRPSAGHVAVVLALGSASQFSDVLFRNDIGVPEANRMNSNLDMAGNQLINVSQITANSGLRIQDELWSLSDTNLAKNVRVGEDLAVQGGLTAADDIVSGKNITAELDLHAKNNLSVDNITTTNQLEVRTSASVKGVASIERIDSKETNIDTIVVDTSGNHLDSANVRLTDLLPRMVFQYSYHVSRSNNLVYKPTCVGGYANARIYVNPMTVTGELQSNTDNGDNSRDERGEDKTVVASANAGASGAISVVNHSDSVWKVVWTGSPDEGTAGGAVAKTYCFYG